MGNSSPVERFVPMDRRRALAQGERLPVRSSGAVLFADVSGFTPLTAVFNDQLGPQRGAEELTKQLNRVFEVLIAAIHLYGGSVITFSGDAITCWFEGDNGRRAVACAFELQREMEQFAEVTTRDGLEFSLALKVAVTVGRANRYLVGHNHIQRLEALAGATLDRVASAEQLLNKGEVIVGAEVIAWFGHQIRIVQWRADERGEYFAVVKSSRISVPTAPWPPISLDAEIGREWLLPPVAERVMRGEGDYLAQLRSSVALFLRFGGIEYDEDREAGAKLDAYIRWVQTVLAKYEGFLLELTIGDKGSYLYIVFGTPLTHENDPARSISAALDLQQPPPGLAFTGPVQIGISQGVMRAGAYGSSQRRSYGVQGQEVNIAARLMSYAEPGQILVSGRILKATAPLFEFESLGEVSLKGLHEPMSAYRVLGQKTTGFVFEEARGVVGPLVGREAELALFQGDLAQLQAGRGSAFVIEGEAGIGKSRLVAEFLTEATRQGIDSLAGGGNEVSHSVAYHGWQAVFQRLFGLDPKEKTDQAWERVMDWLDIETDASLLERVPLLSVVLPFHIPDSELTYQMSGELRATNTYDFLVTILKKATEKRPLILLLEEAHWLDSASWSLVERLKWEEMPLMMLVVTRSLGANHALEENIEHYEQLVSAEDTHHLRLKPLTAEETVQLVCNSLEVRALPDRVGELIYTRTEGHPFFSEELAIALRDTGLLEVKDGTCYLTNNLDQLTELGFPDTIQKVITSRIDRLAPAQQLSLKVSSVLGREFIYQPLHDIYPVAADRPELDDHLGRLEQLAIIDRQGGDQNGGRRYIFKNAITHDIAYNLLLFEQRRQLHRAVGEWYEEKYAADLTGYYAFLAHHWQKSSQPHQAINYLAKAGEQALKNGAALEAISFLTQLVALVGKHEGAWQAAWQPADPGLTPKTQLAIWHRMLSEAYAAISETTQIIHHSRIALALLGRPEPQSRIGLLGSLIRETAVQTAHRILPSRFLGNYQGDLVRLERGRAALSLIEAYYFADKVMASYRAGVVSLNNLDLAGLGTYERVRTLSNFIVGMAAAPRNLFLKGYERLARKAMVESNSKEARALFQFRLGIYYWGVGRWEEAEAVQQEAIDLYRELGHLRMTVECLTNLGVYNIIQGNFKLIEQIGNEVYRMAERQGSTQQMVWGLNFLALYRLKTDEDSREALDQLRASNQLTKGESSELTRELHLCWSAQAHINLGQCEEARQAADEIEERIGKSPPFSSLKLDVYCAMAETFLTIWEKKGKAGDKELLKKARGACRALGRFAFIFPIGRPRSALYWGWYHWLCGRKRIARRHWRKALAEAVALKMPYEEGLAHFEIGRHVTVDEDRDYHLKTAEAIFERLGAGHDLKRCRDILAG